MVDIGVDLDEVRSLQPQYGTRHLILCVEYGLPSLLEESMIRDAFSLSSIALAA